MHIELLKSIDSVDFPNFLPLESNARLAFQILAYKGENMDNYWGGPFRDGKPKRISDILVNE